ncbi:MAG TPA: hypothetical protein VNM90_25820 [Haliangium sp.]|nr:hypothetical protein [Haliangium sp.]
MLRTRTGNHGSPAHAMRRVLLVVAGISLAAATAHTGVAHAGGESNGRQGTLGQVTGAVREHIESRSSPGGGAPTSPGGHGHWYGGNYDTHCPSCGPFVAASPVGGPSVRGPVEPVRVSLSLGLQSVEGSDAAVSGAAAVRMGGFALAIEGAQYFERVAGGAAGSDETIYMDIWSMRMAGRVLRLGAGELWIEGGMGGTGSSGFERVSGTVIGAAFVHAPGREISLRGGARYYVFEHDLQATEAHADFGVSFLSVGYRVLAFGVGPALHGPGLGVHAEF